VAASGQPRQADIDRFLVTSCSRYGSAVAMVFARPRCPGARVRLA